MSSPNIPAQPAPPDYAAANKEAIYTDIETLPTRNLIQQAARLGRQVSYFDPQLGAMRTADFRGLGDLDYAKLATDLATQTNADVQRQQLALRQELGTANAAQTAKEIEAADPQGYAIRKDIYGKVGDGLEKQFDGRAYLEDNADVRAVMATLNRGSKPGTVAVPTADGVKDMTDVELAKYHYETFGKKEGRQGAFVGDARASKDIAGAADRVAGLADRAPQNDARLGALYGEAGNRLESSGNLSVLDRDALLLGQKGMRTLDALQQNTGQLGARTQSRLGSIYDEATQLPTDFSDASMAALSPALRQAAADYQLGGKLNQAELRNLTDNVRAGQAARGNYLGDAAAVEEALRQVQASDAKQQQRLQNLMSVQGQVFGQNDALRNESQAAKLARLGQLTGLQGQEFGQGQSLIQTLAGLQGQQFGQGSATVQTRAGLEQQRFGNEASRLGQLAQLAGQDFSQNQAGYNASLTGANSAMSAATTRSADQRATRTENFGYDQQRLANASSAVLGTPITNQFGALGAAQQGAVGYSPVAVQGAITPNAQAGAQGAQFAQGTFGTQANMWNTSANIASQGSPWMSLLGTALGSAAGAAGAGIGAALV